MRTFLMILAVLSAVTTEEEQVFKVSGLDSYLEAYRESQSESANELLDNAVKKSDNDLNAYPYPQNPYGPSSAPNYGPPVAPNYGPPVAPNYGPPGPQYGAPYPAPAYGPPAPPPPPPPPPVYGPPAPAPIYGPPSSSSVQVFYGVPHALGSIWDKLKFKLTIFTLGKILLKLVIFKKIVSLIAILCLLLFIPSLKHKDEAPAADEGVLRNLRKNEVAGEEQLNNVTAYVMEAIENISNKTKTPGQCDSIYCTTQGIMKKVDKKMSYKKLAKLYFKELQSKHS